MILKETKEYISQNKMIQPGSCVIAALSGGADSVCMLLLLKELSRELGFTLEAVHVEHGIRGEESREDARFAMDLCKKLDITCHMHPVDVPAYAKSTGLGFEEAARILRYAAFEEEAGKHMADGQAVSVAVAHHQEDNAETVIFQMLRGSGVKGLTGIHPVSDKNGVTYIRPLLFASRADIEAYLKENGQNFVTDVTNMDTAYSRNRLRHDVFPVFEQINDRAVEHINESARQLESMYDFFSGQVQAACDEAIYRENEEVVLRIDVFKKLHPALQSGVARECIHMAAGRLKDIGSTHIAMLTELAGIQSGRSIDLPYGITAVRSYDRIILRKMVNSAGQCGGRWEYDNSAVESSTDKKMIISESELSQIAASGTEKKIPLENSSYITLKVSRFNGKMDEIPKKPYTKWLDYDKMKKGFEIRRRKAGDYIIVDDAGHHKKLKAFFINEKVPSEWRDRLWLIAQDSLIQSILGGRSGQSALVTPQTKEVLEITFYGGERNGFFKEI
ncbi:tRNA lysidine(34) synthetase TilS [Agathobacter sp.]